MTMFYVYELIVEGDNLPFYVGKGSGDRWKCHIKEAHQPISKQSNPYKCNVIRNAEKLNKRILCNKHYCGSETESYELETDIILKYGKLLDNSGCLTNIQNGGRSGSNSVPVYVFCKFTGNRISSHVSITDASASTKVHMGDISMCVSNHRHSAGNYIFSRFNKISHLQIKPKIVLYDTIYNSYVKISLFDSQSSAADFLKIRQSLVHKSLNASSVIHHRWIFVYDNCLPPPIQKDFYHAIDDSGIIQCCFFSLADAISSFGADRTGIRRSIQQGFRCKGYHWEKKSVLITYDP